MSLIRSLTFDRSDGNLFGVICRSVSSVGFRDMIVSLGGGTCILVSTLGDGNGFRSTLGVGLSTLGVGTVIDLSAVGFGTLVFSGAF